MVAISLLIATIFIRIYYNRSEIQKIMVDFRTNWKIAIISYRFDSGLQKLSKPSSKLQNKGNKKVETRQKSL